MRCKICHSSRSNEALTPDEVCLSCVSKNAATHWPKPARPHRPCRRCNHHKIIRCIALRERGHTSGDEFGAKLAPLSITFALKKVRTWFNPAGRDVVDSQAPVGFIETYVCQSCGFTEFYTQWPDMIPIGPEYLTEVIDMSPTSAFR